MLNFIYQVFAWCWPAALLRGLAYLMAGTVIWLILNYSTLQNYFAARERLQTYEREVSRLQDQQSRLIEERAQLQAGGFPAEKAIRERFHMVKPGEKIIFVQPPTIEKSGLRSVR